MGQGTPVGQRLVQEAYTSTLVDRYISVLVRGVILLCESQDGFGERFIWEENWPGGEPYHI